MVHLALEEFLRSNNPGFSFVAWGLAFNRKSVKIGCVRKIDKDVEGLREEAFNYLDIGNDQMQKQTNKCKISKRINTFKKAPVISKGIIRCNYYKLKASFNSHVKFRQKLNNPVPYKMFLYN